MGSIASTRLGPSTLVGTRAVSRATGARSAGCGASCSCAPCRASQSASDVLPPKGTGARPRGGAAPWWVRQSKRGTGLTPDGVDPASWDQGTNRSTNDDSATDVSAQNWSTMNASQQRDALDRIGKAAGKDSATTERMVADLVGRGFDVVQQYLHDRVGVEIAQITSDARVAIARIGARGGLTMTDTTTTTPAGGSPQPLTVASDGGSGTALALAAVAGVLLLAKGGRGRR